jgi:ABC-type transport system involved in cytochrome bd biosynthesis fused ATPase/permease subunit
LLLLDGPTSGLDTETERLMVQKLSRLHEITLIMVAQSVAALAITQRLVDLVHGCLLADGSTEHLLLKSAKSVNFAQTLITIISFLTA